MEIRAIEGQEIGEDIWKEKWKELFSLCKELQKENEELRNSSPIHQSHDLLPEHIDNVSSHEKLESIVSSQQNFAHRDDGVHTTLSGMPPRKDNRSINMDKFDAKTITTKPSTAAQRKR
jgi:hypothetical protein